MASLQTGQTELQRVERSRALAQALQAMSLKPRNIVHPMQGYAQLAEALAALGANRSIDRREKAAIEKQREALSKALGPQYRDILTEGPVQQSNVPQELQQKPLFDSGGASLPSSPVPSQPPMELNQLTQMQTSPGILPQQQINALLELDPDTRNQVLGSFLGQQMRVDAGITPQQLTATGASDLYTNVGQRMVEIPGQKPFESYIVREKAPPYRTGIPTADGGIIPMEGKWLKDVVDKTQDVPFGQADYRDFEKLVTEATTAMDGINQLRDNIVGGGLTQKTAVGGVSALLDNVSSTFDQIGLRFNRGQDSVMLDRKFYNTFRVTNDDREKYSAARISEVERAWKRFSALDAENQAISISLAYTLARIADPGGRLSEMDVMNQMLALGLDQPSPERRLSALSTAERRFAKTVETRLWFARQRAGELAPDLPPGFEQRINEILYNKAPINNGQNSEQHATIALQDAWAKGNPAERLELERRFPGLLRQMGLIQ